MTRLARCAIALALSTLAHCAAPTEGSPDAAPDGSTLADAAPDGSTLADAAPPDGPAPDVSTDVPASVTWSEHIAPLVYQHCASCHRPDSIAPFSLLTYADARPRSVLLAMETAERRMPPTLVDNSGACRSYDHTSADWLTEQEIALLRAWHEAGAPEGDASRTPAAPAPPGGLARVDAHVDMGLTYTPDPTVTDDLRCFVVDPGITHDQFVTGFQVEPGDRRVVHHMIVYALPTAESEASAMEQDARDPLPGYRCPGGSNAEGSYPVVLWAPGGPATQLPAGTGLRLNAGRRVVMQLHYNLLNGSFPDRTTVSLQLADTVEREARMVPVRPANLTLPPRQASATAEGMRTIPAALGRQVRVWGVAPHMHTTGIDMTLSLRSTGACAMDLQRWNFHWQRMFFYTDPVSANAGDAVSIRCAYNTMGRDAVTTWGEGTEDEMCLAYLYVTPQ